MNAIFSEICNNDEKARAELRDFINEGLADLEKGDLYSFEQVFDEVEKKYIIG